MATATWFFFGPGIVPKERPAALGTLLGAALCGAGVLWPYAQECGLGLYAYLGAESMIVVGGVWVAACTWRQRMAGLHAFALLVALWGLALTGHQVLARTGYVHIEGDRLPQWSCSG